MLTFIATCWECSADLATAIQGTFNWLASCFLYFILNYLLLKRMFDLFDNRDKCRKSGFLRCDIYTSCISMVLWDHFANKRNTFQHSLTPSLSLPLSLSHFLLFPSWVSTSSYPRYQDTAIKGTFLCPIPPLNPHSASSPEQFIEKHLVFVGIIKVKPRNDHYQPGR